METVWTIFITFKVFCGEQISLINRGPSVLKAFFIDIQGTFLKPFLFNQKQYIKTCNI